MRRIVSLAGACLLGMASMPAQAQADVDPARLAAAHRLMDEIMPPAQRDALMRAIIKPMIDNLRAAIAKDPTFSNAMEKDPRVGEVMNRFMERIIKQSFDGVGASMPKMIDAMSIAYARQFSVAELEEVRAFYRTPTGRAFMSKMPQLMADPAVVAAQRQMMTDQIGRMPALLKDLNAEMAKLKATAK